MADSKGAQAAAPSAKTARKVNKLLEVTADESLKQAIAFLDDIYGGGAGGEKAAPPRSSTLRHDLDTRLQQLHADFLHQFAAVDARYRQVCTGVDTLAHECSAARAELSAVKASSLGLMDAAETLQAEYEEIKQREEQVHRFMEQFQLTRDETDVLRDPDVTPRFVAVLDKVQRIHASCRSMVLPEQQQAAIEIQEAMYLAQVSGVEKLARHITHVVGDVFSADSPDVSDFLVQALACLRAHPGPWEKAMQEIARVRRTTVVRRFLNLTSSSALASAATSSVGSSRNLRRAAAVDVLRLAGDLCAWLHQAVAEDTDMLTPLFDTRGGPGASDSSATMLSKVDVLDQIFEGVCRHLRDKIHNALSEAGCTSVAVTERVDLDALLVLFKLEGLLGFYLTTTEALLGQHAALSECLRGLRLDALRVFLEGLQAAMRKIAHTATVIPVDLAVPSEVHGILRMLRLMMEHLQASFVPHQQREVDFAPVLGAVVDPIVALADTAQLPATLPTDQRENARDVHKVNCLCAILTAVLPFDFATARQAKLTASMEQVLVGFSQRNAAALRTKFGLDARYKEMTDTGGGSDFDERALRDTASGFFTYIYNVEGLTVPQLAQLQALRIRDRLRVDITSAVCDAYERLYNATAARVTPEMLKEVLYHSPPQLRVLLDVEESGSGKAGAATTIPALTNETTTTEIPVPIPEADSAHTGGQA
jgi:hypothetical protein